MRHVRSLNHQPCGQALKPMLSTRIALHCALSPTRPLPGPHMQQAENSRSAALAAQLRDQAQASVTAYATVCKELTRSSKSKVVPRPCIQTAHTLAPGSRALSARRRSLSLHERLQGKRLH